MIDGLEIDRMLKNNFTTASHVETGCIRISAITPMQDVLDLENIHRQMPDPKCASTKLPRKYAQSHVASNAPTKKSLYAVLRSCLPSYGMRPSVRLFKKVPPHHCPAGAMALVSLSVSLSCRSHRLAIRNRL